MHSSDELNGKDHRDFPIPHEYRVSRDASTGRWNYTQLAGAILKGLLDYENVLPQVHCLNHFLFLDYFSLIQPVNCVNVSQYAVQSFQGCRVVTPRFVFSQRVRLF